MPPKRSDRPRSLHAHGSSQVSQGTARQLLELLQRSGVRQVTLRHHPQYCSRVLSDSGAQFVVYTGDGVNTFDKGSVVVKCSRLRVDKDGNSPKVEKDRDRAAALYREVQILTHWRLQSHPNIPTLLWYDFIDVGDNLHMPALIVERADSGSLSMLIRNLWRSLTEYQRIKLCNDVTAGLLALHQAGAVHGDVKSENVLVFSSSNEKDAYIAKVADFGSAIIVGEQEEPDAQRPWRYQGTPTVNAPEVADQTSARLSATGLRKCDNYSLGLLILEVAVGYLDEEAETKASSVLEHAIAHIEGTEFSDASKTTLKAAIQRLLQFSNENRCGDLSVIEHIFNPLAVEQLDVTNSLQLGSTGSSPKVEEGRDVAAALKSRFGISDYLNIDLDVEQQTEWDTQARVVKRLREASKHERSSESGKALFQLALASACGFGMPYNEDKALAYATEAARKGYLAAQANVMAFYMALGRTDEARDEEHMSWLFAGVAWGSFVAAACLRRLSPSTADDARDAFHHAGGYNQFFYPREPPSYIHSAEFAGSLSSQQADLSALAQAAAVYGDATLLSRLFALGVSPNLTNLEGESLLLLCCKGGHLEVLKVLVSFGANTASVSLRDSPLHWLVAFDEACADEAARLLRHIISELDTQTLPGMTWNHPCIDLPGSFPLGSPLHYVMMANAPVHIKSLLKHFPEIPFNWKGSSQVSPLEFGVPRLKITAATPIINAGALASQTPPSGNVLQELGSTLLPEVWVAMAQTGLSREDIVHSCLELVLGKDPELLNNADEAGFTPLMGASQYHDCTVIQAMLRRGANVQARTSVEYDGRTALNLITTNKAQWPARDCTFELLLEAGADPDMPSRPGGKRLLHFAARDDDVVTAKKLLNLALDASLGPETADEDVARMVNSRTELYGQTPLHIAAQYGSARVVRLLLDHGAETDIGHFRGTFNAWDWDGLTPLAVASCMAQTSVIQLLLDHEHASSLARPVSHHSVLHLAAAEPDGGKMLRMLLNIPAINGSAGLLNGPAKGGVTPLHLCASNMGRVEHARILLDAGADPNTRSKSGHSVLDAALALRSRIASFLAKWEGISESGTQTEFADVLAQEIDLWQPVTQAGGRFSLVLKEKGQKIYIPVEEVIRYRDEFEREDGAENESEGEHTKSDQQSQSTLPPSDESEGDDGPAILDFKDMLTEVDGMVDMIRQGGGTFGTTDPIPENLFAMKI